MYFLLKVLVMWSMSRTTVTSLYSLNCLRLICLTNDLCNCHLFQSFVREVAYSPEVIM